MKKPAQPSSKRDERIAGLSDEDEPTFYSCTLCQSFAPSHVCVVTPERTGLCGAYNWLDCKAAFEINPTGPNQPIEKGEVLDDRLGKWDGVNELCQTGLARQCRGRQRLQHHDQPDDVVRLF